VSGPGARTYNHRDEMAQARMDPIVGGRLFRCDVSSLLSHAFSMWLSGFLGSRLPALQHSYTGRCSLSLVQHGLVGRACAHSFDLDGSGRSCAGASGTFFDPSLHFRNFRLCSGWRGSRARIWIMDTLPGIHLEVIRVERTLEYA
jgi:hypothetical protein